MAEEDNELEKLLKDLEETTKGVEEPEPSPQPELVLPSSAPPPVIAPAIVPDNYPEVPKPDLAPPLAPSEGDNTPIQKITQELDAESTAEEILDVRAVVKRHEVDYNKISRQIAQDRGKIDAALNLLIPKIENGTAKSAEVEALTRLLQTLSDTSGHAVRLLDSKSKLLTSAKSTVAAFIQNINAGGGGSGAELRDILSQAPREDEDV